MCAGVGMRRTGQKRVGFIPGPGELRELAWGVVTDMRIRLSLDLRSDNDAAYLSKARDWESAKARYLIVKHGGFRTRGPM